MNDFHGSTQGFTASKTFEPYMAIARQLNPTELSRALKLFEPYKIDLSFLCDELCIRRFNDARNQYEVASRHPFKTNKQSPPSIYNPLPLFLF